MEIRFTGYDPNGIPRVWGEGNSADIAETRAVDAAKDYVSQTPRPDVKPLSAWTFRKDS